MAKIVKREWTSRGPLGRKVRHVAFGYALTGNGKRERKVSSEWRSEADALDALNRRLKEIDAGQTPRRNVTLEALTEQYLKYKANQGKRSLKDDTRILRNRLLPHFGATRLARHLTEADIAQYEQQRIGEVSAYTVANELAVLRHLLRLARKWGYLERAPDITLPKKPEGRTRFLTEDEIRRLLEACAVSRNPYLHTIITLAVNTGMRKGELLGLDWARVDLRADFGFSAKITLYRTKNGKPRGVPLNRAAVESLLAVEPDPEHRIGSVFKQRNGVAWGKITTAFGFACERAGLQGVRFHDLRHTAASHMVMRGRTLQDVKEILGHADIRMTMRYAHLSPTHLRGAVEALDGLTPLAFHGHTAETGAEDTEMAHKITHKTDS
jgi:integrase